MGHTFDEVTQLYAHLQPEHLNKAGGENSEYKDSENDRKRADGKEARKHTNVTAAVIDLAAASDFGIMGCNIGLAGFLNPST